MAQPTLLFTTKSLGRRKSLQIKPSASHDKYSFYPANKKYDKIFVSTKKLKTLSTNIG
jgi:hypothetical protein